MPENLAVSSADLGEIQTQKSVQLRVGATLEILAGHGQHFQIVALLASRVNRVSSLMPAQIPVESRADVKQLVKDRHELVVEAAIEKSRQTERDDVVDLFSLVKELLNLKRHSAMDANPLAIAKTHGRDASLQTMAAEVARLRECEEHSRNVQMSERLKASGDVCAQPTHVVGELERLPGVSRMDPGGRFNTRVHA